MWQSFLAALFRLARSRFLISKLLFSSKRPYCFGFIRNLPPWRFLVPRINMFDLGTEGLWFVELGEFMNSTLDWWLFERLTLFLFYFLLDSSLFYDFGESWPIDYLLLWAEEILIDHRLGSLLFLLSNLLGVLKLWLSFKSSWSWSWSWPWMWSWSCSSAWACLWPLWDRSIEWGCSWSWECSCSSVWIELSSRSLWAWSSWWWCVLWSSSSTSGITYPSTFLNF